jgi:hypothetical protein
LKKKFSLREGKHAKWVIHEKRIIKAFFVKVSHVAPLQGVTLSSVACCTITGATVSQVAGSQGATLSKRRENEEIREVSRREALNMRCPPIGLDITCTPDLRRS